MEIGLIDADLLDRGTRFPNLALMKLSSYHKKRNHNTNLIKYKDINEFDKVYISKVFDFTELPNTLKENVGFNMDYYPNTEIIKGGTGCNYEKSDFLPDKIEHIMPDYELYSKYNGLSKYYTNHSIGFTTRFCFRQCKFCVNRNKKKAVRWSSLEEFDFYKNDNVTLLDDNILAHSDRMEILEKLENNDKPFEFKQGIDIRLINNEIAHFLANCNYGGSFNFAFDDIDDKEVILEKLKIWEKHWNKNRTKFYVLCGFDKTKNYDESFWLQDIINTFERIKIMFKHGCYPYVMRYKKYKNSPFSGLYINIASWTNQPHLFKKMSFREFSKARKGARWNRVKHFESLYPEIAKEYFDMKWNDFN